MKNIEPIKSVVQLAGRTLANCYCCADATGNIVLASNELLTLLGYKPVELTSIYQVNPEVSFLSWKKIINELGPKPQELKGKYITASNEVKDCKLTYLTFEIEKSRYCLYGIIDPNQKKTLIVEEAVSNDANQKKTIKQNIPQKTIINDGTLQLVNKIDENSHFAILYFDEKGKLLNYNNNLIPYVKKDQLKGTVDNLFLDTDIGPLLDALEKLPFKNNEYLIRIILKSVSGFKDGYGRITQNKDLEDNIVYRMEFTPLDKINMIGKPIERPNEEVERLINELELSKEVAIDHQVNDFSFDEIVTKSPKYKAVLRQLAQVADTDTTVLITGETGTGKELLCNALYKLSDRSDEVIVKVNCAAIPENLIESALFGHEKGAFTGADSRKIGKFELANHGTIFLDEIGEMPLDMQAKLLRVLQEGEVERVGNATPIKVDVRVIAATNRNLEKMVKERTFREDLYYRLSVFPIFNLPLRDRLEDIPVLVEHFIHKSNKKTGRNVKKIRPSDMSMLKSYNYPGNVRELENIIERSIVLSSGEYLDLQLNWDISNTKDNSTEAGVFLSYDEMQINHIKKAIIASQGKVTGKNSAAELLQINGKTLVSKINKFKIDLMAIKKEL